MTYSDRLGGATTKQDHSEKRLDDALVNQLVQCFPTNVAELKLALKKCGEVQTGNKSVLEERLRSVVGGRLTSCYHCH